MNKKILIGFVFATLLIIPFVYSYNFDEGFTNNIDIYTINATELNFTMLSDTPAGYGGSSNYFTRVNAGGDGLVFYNFDLSDFWDYDYGDMINVPTFLSNFTNDLGFYNTTQNSTSWNRSGTNVFLANSGDSVGIGTTTPQRNLHVVGDILSNATINATGDICLEGGACLSEALLVESDPIWNSAKGDYWNISESLDFSTNLTTTGNISAAYFFGDGSGLSGIGGVNSNGSSNYIPRFVNSSYLTDSAIYDDGLGNVGIGTSSPDAKLSVIKNLTIKSEGGEDRFMFNGNTNGSAGRMDIYDANENAGIVLNANIYQPSYILTNQFGINTSTPQNALNVIGDVAIGSNDVDSIDAYANNRFLVKGDSSSTRGNAFVMYDNTSQQLLGNELLMKTNNSNRGNAFIMTNDVNYNTWGFGTVYANSKKFSIGYVDDYTSEGFFQETEAMRGDNSLFTIDASNGNVGIGTEIPTSRLHVQDSDSTVFDASVSTGQEGDGSTLSIINDDGTTGSFSQINFQTSHISARATARIAAVDTGEDNNDLVFVTEGNGNPGERMRIDSSGNVGIGTTTPQNKLNVIGDFNQTTGNSFYNGIYAGMWFYNNTGVVVDLVTPNTYVNVTDGFEVTHLNGFTFNDTFDYLQVDYEGVYKIDWSVSFEGGNANTYGIVVAKNFNVSGSRNCYSQRTTSSNAIGNVGGACLLDLSVGDTINFQMDDEANPVSDPTIYQVNIVVTRVGNN